MSERPSRGTRKRIRKLKIEIRDVAKTPDEDWEAMQEMLRLRIPDFAQVSADGRLALIQDWFRTRQDIRYLSPSEQREKIVQFQSKYPRENLMAVKDALAIITQTFSK